MPVASASQARAAGVRRCIRPRYQRGSGSGGPPPTGSPLGTRRSRLCSGRRRTRSPASGAQPAPPRSRSTPSASAFSMTVAPVACSQAARKVVWQMKDPELRLVEVSFAADDVDAMVRFYDELFGAGLEPYEAFGTTFYRGTLDSVRFVLAPNALAGVDAAQNRHQFVYATSDLDALLARAERAGGVVRDRAANVAIVLDPDGNTVVLQGTRSSGV